MTPQVDGRDKKQSSPRNGNSYVYSMVQTPPPGFTLDKKNKTLSLDTINRTGAGSAPPRSFITEEPFDNKNSLSQGYGFSGHDQLRMMLRPSSESGRSNSFVNLAAALGEGLAESIGDSLKDNQDEAEISKLTPKDNNESVPRKRDGSHHSNSGVKNDSVEMGMNNFDRQSRHSLTHLVGSTAAMTIGQQNNSISNSNNQKGNPELLNSNRSSTMSIHNTPAPVTIVEPDNTPSPIPYHFMNFDQNDEYDNRNERSSRFGTASAPPQVFDENNFSFRFSSQATLRKETAQYFQQRSAQLLAPRTQSNCTSISASESAPGPALLPSSQPRLPASSPAPQTAHHEIETESQKELKPYIWISNSVTSQNNNMPSQSSSPSRCLAIFGISKLPVSEVRSTCEAFGSLLYFRSDFVLTKNVIFIAYHDLRSACHASNELKTYLQNISSSNLNDIDARDCQAAIRVMFCVSLVSQSEYDESTLMITNVPYSVNKEAVTQMMASFGAIQTIQQLHVGNESMALGGSFLIRFYNILDANHCLLEMQGTMPWGPSSAVKSMRRSEQERKRGQELLALISNWRTGYRTIPLQATKPLPQSIDISKVQPSPSPPVFVDENKYTSFQSTPPTSLESTSPPIFAPPAPQLMVGPDGQISYVIVQPTAYHTTAVPQYVQNSTVVPTIAHSHTPLAHSHNTHQQHAITSAQILYDGQNYWFQHSGNREHVVSTQHHVPTTTYHHVVPGPHQVSYPVMPIYSGPNTVVQTTESSLSSGSQTPHYYVSNQTSPTSHETRKQSSRNVDPGNQRNSLDIDAVKQGWDVRTSLMIRNIPNKYTRSMLLSEFKECGHGPGKIDFFYLPIDFRNKCNRGYAFLNFVNYRDIITFYDAYNGKGWRTFKSDKICEITYARIQGKMSMLKRFQNSALMEKDPEYRPVVFNEKGEVCSPNGESENNMS